ncbi:aldo/keto reductase [Campylobacter mucosalis]|uniref:aldo/keto reductase n=1 Tax=Campylobacter mucosalis TaxID=202 RepID=UPI00146FF51D|nr:aldo/keto reductase [Campylobacter mucosalis]
MKTINLSDKTKMPLLGFGVYQIENSECQRCVSDALEVGYRLIDTARAYANEKAVGEAVSKSGIKRDEIFITSKLWISDYSEDKALRAVEDSLRNLKTDYIDLFLLHQPFNDIYGAWRALSRLKNEGVLKEIGVSNFYSDRLMDLWLNSEVKPVLNQIETNPFYQRTFEQNFMSKLGVVTQSWASFGEGRNNMFKNETLTKIASKHGKSVAQIILAWLVGRGVGVLPKSVNKERMRENFDIFSFTLDSDDLADISTLETGKSLFFSHADPQIVKMLNELKR